MTSIIEVSPWKKNHDEEVEGVLKFTHVYWCEKKKAVCSVRISFLEASPITSAPDGGTNVLTVTIDFQGETYTLKARAKQQSFELLRDALRFSIKERETQGNFFLGLMGIPEWVLEPPCRRIIGRKRKALPMVSAKGKLRAGNNVSLYSFKAVE